MNRDIVSIRTSSLQSDTEAFPVKIVISRGNSHSRLMLIGEAPGATEEKLGKPFVGRSGKLLDNLLESIGFDLDKDLYICNVIKSRPPSNRKPNRKEIARHLPWLNQQIKLINPYIIVIVGSTALEALLGMKCKISHIRGTWHKYNGIDAMPIFHPSFLLRNPSKACGSPFDLTRLDLSNVKERLDRFKLSFDIPLSADKKISQP